MKYRKSLLALSLCLSSLGVFAQSFDEKIGDAMNRSDWFALDSIYSAAPKDSLNPFLEVFSRCLIGNRLNRPDVSIPAFKELLETQSGLLDLSNLISSTLMYGMDLSRVGRNEDAASVTNAVIDAILGTVDSGTISQLTAQANRYSALAAYNPYQITIAENQSGTIPFKIVPVGPKEKENFHMRLVDSSINGIAADITFDTGAGTNVVSPDMVEKYNLIPLEGTSIEISGMAKRDGYVAVAKEIKMGNVTVTDVPFTVIDLSSGNEEADQYMKSLSIVIGSDLMLQFKDVTLNFDSLQIEIPLQQDISVKTDAKPNLCFSSGMNLLCAGSINNDPMLMNIDSGDSSYGSLGYTFFERNREYVIENGAKDKVRFAGVAGVAISECYNVPDMPLSMGGETVKIPAMVVRTEQPDSRYECNIGLKTLMLYSFVRFNLVDFVLTTGISAAVEGAEIK